MSAFDVVAESFADVNIYIVGEGDRDRYLCLSQKSPFRERIHFEGYSAHPYAYLSSADVFVLASRRESFPLVLLEARSAGCAIVACDVDGTAEALDYGNAGILVPPMDPRALASAIKAVLSDKESSDSLRQRAPKNMDGFTTRTMAQNLLELYGRLAK